MNRHRRKATGVGVDGDHEIALLEVLEPVRERLRWQRKEWQKGLASRRINCCIAVVIHTGKRAISEIDHQIGVLLGRHIVSRQPEDVQQMRAHRVRYIEVQMNANNVVERGAIGGVWLEIQPVDRQQISQLGSLRVERKERLAQRVGMRRIERVEVVDHGMVTRFTRSRSACQRIRT